MKQVFPMSIKMIMFCLSKGKNGHLVPPLFILPRKKMDKHGRLIVAAPLDSIAIPHESGRMIGDMFLRWLQQFFKHHVQPLKVWPLKVNNLMQNKTFKVFLIKTNIKPLNASVKILLLL